MNRRFVRTILDQDLAGKLLSNSLVFPLFLYPVSYHQTTNTVFSIALCLQVARTGKGGFIPVYRDVKNGRTRIVTIVKKASGDMEVS